MPYGNGQRLGETIDPRLMQADYSGFTNAGAIAGNTWANAGKQIGDALKLHGDEKKQHTQAEQMAKSMAKAIPEFKPMADEFLKTMANPDLSHRDRTAMAAGIQDSLKLAVLGREFANEDRDFDNKERMAANDMAFRDKELDMRAQQIRASMMPDGKLKETSLPYVKDGVSGQRKALIDERGNYFDAKTKQPLNGDGRAISNALPQSQSGDYPDNMPTASDTPMPGLDFPNYGTFNEAMGGIDVDGAPGVLPPRHQAAQQIKQALTTPQAEASSEDMFFEPDVQKEGDKPQEYTLPDGSKVYGTIKNGILQMAKMPDGSPMRFTEGQTLTAKEKIDIEAKQKEANQIQSGAVAKSENFLSLLDKLENHKGFKNLFGTNLGAQTWMAGTDAADAKVLFKQIDAKGFMEAIKEMKGMGALSNSEGEKASAAFLGLDPSMSEDAAKQAIKEAKAIIKQGIERSKSGNLFPTETTNPRAANANRLRDLIPNPLTQ